MITLAIIGIIAAMTVPNLISSYKKSQAETGVKVAFSILSNSIAMAKSEYGSVEQMVEDCRICEVGSQECTADKEQLSCFANNYLNPYLKYVKSCDKAEDDNSGGENAHWAYKRCIMSVHPVAQYKDLDGKFQNKSRHQPIFQQALKLNNGMYVGMMWGTTVAPYFAVDVNGTAGPNQVGADLFFFALYEPEYDQSGKLTRNKIANGLRCENRSVYLNEAKNKANWCKESDRLGVGCACLLQSNGWKFPKDYPIKKWSGASKPNIGVDFD